MAEERDDEQFGEQDPTKKFGQANQQPPAGQQGELGQEPLGEQGQQPFGQESQTGEFGQQGQSSSGQSDLAESGDTATLSDEQGGSQSPGGSVSSQQGGGGFIGSQGSDSTEQVQEEQGSTGETDFASQGQGALEDEDIESGQPQSRDSDIDGSSGNI